MSQALCKLAPLQDPSRFFRRLLLTELHWKNHLFITTFLCTFRCAIVLLFTPLAPHSDRLVCYIIFRQWNSDGDSSFSQRWRCGCCSSGLWRSYTASQTRRTTSTTQIAIWITINRLWPPVCETDGHRNREPEKDSQIKLAYTLSWQRYLYSDKERPISDSNWESRWNSLDLFRVISSCMKGGGKILEKNWRFLV
jgi:hypothetical protein